MYLTLIFYYKLEYLVLIWQKWKNEWDGFDTDNTTIKNCGF